MYEKQLQIAKKFFVKNLSQKIIYLEVNLVFFLKKNLLLPFDKKSYFCFTTLSVYKSINLFLLSLSSLKNHFLAAERR